MRVIDVIALAMLASVFLTMPFYAAAGRSRFLDPEVVRRSKTFLIGRWVRNWVIWALTPLERAAVAARARPDTYSWAGLVLAAGAGLAFAVGELSIGAWLVLFSGATDIVDGRIARARRIESRYGAFLDAALDRFCDWLVFLGLCWYFHAVPWALVSAVLAVSGSLLVSYMRAVGDSLGADCDAGLMQRAERLVAVAVAAILDRPLAFLTGWRPGTLTGIAVLVVAVGSVGTAVYRTIWISRALRARSTSSVTPAPLQLADERPESREATAESARPHV